MQSEIHPLMELKLKKMNSWEFQVGKLVISTPSLEEVMKTLIATR